MRSLPNISSLCSHSSSGEGAKSSGERIHFRQDEISHFQPFTAGEQDARNKENENVREEMVSSHAAPPKLKRIS